jgi:hypothetical protein
MDVVHFAFEHKDASFLWPLDFLAFGVKSLE